MIHSEIDTAAMKGGGKVSPVEIVDQRLNKCCLSKETTFLPEPQSSCKLFSYEKHMNLTIIHLLLKYSANLAPLHS